MYLLNKSVLLWAKTVSDKHSKDVKINKDYKTIQWAVIIAYLAVKK